MYSCDGELNQLGLALSRKQLSQFSDYSSYLLECNKHINLTSINNPEDVDILHFVDSLTACMAIGDKTKKNGRVLDIGTGAGFPGIPIKLVLPGIFLTLIESSRRKADFLENLLRVLDLSDVDVVNSRSEDAARDFNLRESFDLVLCRGVAEMAVLVELSLPFLKIGGLLVAHKKGNIVDEMRKASLSLTELGGKFIDTLRVDVKRLEGRSIVIVSKISPTPEKFPRRAGIPKKRPIYSRIRSD